MRRPDKERVSCAVRWAVLTLAVALIAIGVAGEEQLEVFWKAVTICLECIGIA